MTIAIAFLLLFGGLAALIAFFLSRNFCTESEEGFYQAGVKVDYKNKLVTIKNSTYHVDNINNLIWHRGTDSLGNSKDNFSYAAIHLNDGTAHEINFMTSAAAEHFVSRLQMAIAKSRLNDKPPNKN